MEKNKDLTIKIEDTSSEQIKTVEDLLKYFNTDLDEWRVHKYKINKWDVTSWKSGGPETKQNFSVKVDLEKKEEENLSEMALQIFEDKVKNFKPPTFKLEELNIPYENNLLEISIFDLHFGKLAWVGETGEQYNTETASKRFIGALKQLVARASKHGFNRILFPIGNDFFNSDNLFNTTTKGTHQDEELRWQQTFDLGLDLILNAVHILKQTGKPIDILVIPGNHDIQRSYYMGSAIQRIFANDSQVEVNNKTLHGSLRKYYNFGKVLLGFTHGNSEKESSLPMLMATEEESKKYWDKCIFKEWHLAHSHRKKKVDYIIFDKTQTLDENFGITVRYLSSLTGTDGWHHRKGFVAQIKAAEAFLWNGDSGLIAHFNCNVDIEKE